MPAMSQSGRWTRKYGLRWTIRGPGQIPGNIQQNHTLYLKGPFRERRGPRGTIDSRLPKCLRADVTETESEQVIRSLSPISWHMQFNSTRHRRSHLSITSLPSQRSSRHQESAPSCPTERNVPTHYLRADRMDGKAPDKFPVWTKVDWDSRQ
jgi:hypothetical protein